MSEPPPPNRPTGPTPGPTPGPTGPVSSDPQGNLGGSEGSPGLPGSLVADLRRLYGGAAGSATAFPPDMDAEVLAAARERLSRRAMPRTLPRSRVWRIGGVGGGLAAAAAVALVAYVAWPTRPAGPGAGGAPVIAGAASTGEPLAAADRSAGPMGRSLEFGRPPTGATPEGDLNHDGRIDILDARVLALALRDRDRAEPGPVALAGGDVDHDGAVDQRDVDALALLAVRLTPAPGAQPAVTGEGGGS